MTYSIQTWRDYPSGGTSISAARLNHMEQGIADAHTLLAGGTTGGGTTTTPNPEANVAPGFWNAKIDFGCAGDGLQDDSVALNLGLANGGYIFLPPGDFLCTQELAMTSTTPTYLFGPGRIVSQNNGNIITMSGAAHVVDGIRIQGGGSSLLSQLGIAAQSNFCVVKNTDIKGIARAGISMTGSYGRIEGNWLNHCSVGTGASDDSVASIHVSGDHVKTTLNHLSDTEVGILYSGSATATNGSGLIEGNTLWAADGGTGVRGIAVFYGINVRVANNHAGNYSGQGIYLYSPTYATVVGNVIYQSQSDGIFVGHDAPKAVTVTGNEVRECANGIVVWDGAQQVNVTGNEVSNCGDGINARGAVNTGDAPLSNIRIESNIITINATLGGRGVTAKSINGLSVAHNSIINAAHQGIYASDITYCDINNNQVKGAGQDTTGTWAGIETAADVNFLRIDDNLCAGTADLAIKIGGGTAVRARGNRWDNISTGITNNATGAVLSDNVGW